MNQSFGKIIPELHSLSLTTKCLLASSGLTKFFFMPLSLGLPLLLRFKPCRLQAPLLLCLLPLGRFVGFCLLLLFGFFFGFTRSLQFFQFRRRRSHSNELGIEIRIGDYPLANALLIVFQPGLRGLVSDGNIIGSFTLSIRTHRAT